nr:MAG TPA: hypothetical protein [Caudoviricetes sp.]
MSITFLNYFKTFFLFAYLLTIFIFSGISATKSQLKLVQSINF